MRVEWLTVRALVVARWRELAQDRIRLVGTTLVTLLVPAVAATPHATTSGLFGVEVGVLSVVVAAVDLSRGQLNLAPRTGLSVPRAYCFPALPVTLLSRLAAVGVVAIALSTPFLVLTSVVGTLIGQSYAVAAARFFGIAVGIGVGLAWYRFDRGRLARLFTRSASFITVRPPKRLSELGAVFWMGLPTTILWMLILAPLCVGLVMLFLSDAGLASAHPLHPRLLRLSLSMPAYAVWLSAFSSVFVSLRTLAVSRRAIAIAELYLSVLMSVFCIVFTLALTQAVAGELRLTRATAHLLAMLSAVGVLSRVAYVRMASLTDSKAGGLSIYIAWLMFGMLGFAALSFYVSRHVLDGIAAAALLSAVVLAYTAPRTALSQPARGV